jgi:hypothetical protein
MRERGIANGWIFPGVGAGAGHSQSRRSQRQPAQEPEQNHDTRQIERTQAKLAAPEKPGEQSDKSQAAGLLRLPEQK